MIGKKLTKIIVAGILAFCVWLRVDVAAGGDAVFNRYTTKINAPMEVKLSFTSAPMLNELAVLNIEITALRDAPNTQIDIELPGEGFQLISGSTQLNEDLASNSTTTYQLEVMPVAAGQYIISASATSEGADFIFGKREKLYVNIDDGFSELSKSSFIPEIANHRSEATKIDDISC